MKPKKITFKDFFESISSFYNNTAFEKKQAKKIDAQYKNIKKKLGAVDTRAGLEAYVRSEKDALNCLTTIMGISEEQFKRVVSMIRRGKGDFFKSEWSVKTVRNIMVKDSWYMNEICNLLLNGRNITKYQRSIPTYILEQFYIDSTRLKQITAKKVLRQYIKASLKGDYSVAVGTEVEDFLEKKIKSWCKKYSTTYVREKKVSWIPRNIDFIIPDEHNPQILIEVSYMVTTGSGQTTKQRDERDTYKKIKDYNYSNSQNIVFVNYIDGAGWIARHKDLEHMYDSSDYVINYKNVDLLEEIIKECK